MTESELDAMRLDTLCELVEGGAEESFGPDDAKAVRRVLSDAIRLRAENEQCDADMREAAGELLVDLPEPGTTLAKLLSANVLLRRENERLAQQHFAALTKLDDENSRLRAENERLRSGAGTTLSEDEVEFIRGMRSHADGLERDELPMIGDEEFRLLLSLVDRLSSVAPREEPRLSDVLAWLRGRPGASWVATIQDIETAVAAIGSAPVERREGNT